MALTERKAEILWPSQQYQKCLDAQQLERGRVVQVTKTIIENPGSITDGERTEVSKDDVPRPFPLSIVWEVQTTQLGSKKNKKSSELEKKAKLFIFEDDRP